MKTSAQYRALTRSLTLPVLSALMLSTFSSHAFAAAKGTPAPNFGPNVRIFDPTMAASQIQAAASAIATQQISNQFGTQRYAFLFKPGTYGTATSPLNFNVGYYTEIDGLGASPDDTAVNGTMDVYNQCDSSGCNATSNFWRSLNNMELNITKLNAGCYAGEFWAVSQDAPLRRVHFNGSSTLMDYCTGPSDASGGFIADTVTGSVVNGSQQQYYVRNSTVASWSNAVWNQVFSGVNGAPAQGYPNPTYTTLPATPVSREKPYLTVDNQGNYSVIAPAVATESIGPTWASGIATTSRSIPISKFFIAYPITSAQEINAALESGKNLLLTPGVYDLEAPIKIGSANTVVLGMGFATLVPQTGKPAIEVADVGGVQIAGVIVDAGPVTSPVLVKVGVGALGEKLPVGGGQRHAGNPTALSDISLRIGGPTAGSAGTALQVDSADVILDDIWAWRADHGASPNAVGWTVNTANHGLVVNGDHVTATGLAVEHFQQQQVQWNGNNGETIFYQSELPYDPPSQQAWKYGQADGYPSYVVNGSVTKHNAYGLGIYSFFSQGINIIEQNAITVPFTKGVNIYDAGTVFLNGNGEITHVINNTGAAVNSSYADQVSPVVTYP